MRFPFPLPRFRPLLLTCLVLLLSAVPQAGLRAQAQATPFARTGHVSVELSADVEAAVPGEPFRLGLRQTIDEGWHTYWRNPGDSGAATRLEWHLPPGVTAGPVLWPLPEAIPYFDLMNYGYEGETFLMTELVMPKDWPVGKPVEIGVTVDWLVCSDVCIPETVDLAITLPSMAGPVRIHPMNGLAFEQAQERLPRRLPLEASHADEGDTITLAVDGLPAQGRIDDAYFFAGETGIIRHSAPQAFTFEDGRLVLTLERDASAAGMTGPMEGLLVLHEDPGDGPIEQGLLITAGPAAASAADGALPLWQAALFAFLGGLILNLMPCVFPVLSMKALALVRHAGEPGALRQGLVYAAGVMLSFLALATILIVMKAGGAAVGWGFQLQSPLVVALLAYLMITVGLWLAGALELGGSIGERLQGGLMNTGSGLAGREGHAGSFFTGVLAVIVATPCTAPFMAPALGFALTRDAATALAVFAALGAGFALPFVLLGAVPAFSRLLPRPGAWMVRLKEFMAFPMFATAAWLVWVLALQLGPSALLPVLMGMVVLGLGLWLLRFARALPRALCGLALVAALALAAWPVLHPVGRSAAAAGTGTSGLVDPDGPARPFDQATLDRLVADGRPVFVNMTAAWCITCLVNEETALSSKAVEEAIASRGITYMKGDWTNADPAITAFLEHFGRSGVPLYVLYPGKNRKPVLLPQILTESIVLDALSRTAG